MSLFIVPTEDTRHHGLQRRGPHGGCGFLSRTPSRHVSLQPLYQPSSDVDMLFDSPFEYFGFQEQEELQRQARRQAYIRQQQAAAAAAQREKEAALQRHKREQEEILTAIAAATFRRQEAEARRQAYIRHQREQEARRAALQRRQQEQRARQHALIQRQKQQEARRQAYLRQQQLQWEGATRSLASLMDIAESLFAEEEPMDDVEFEPQQEQLKQQAEVPNDSVSTSASGKGMTNDEVAANDTPLEADHASDSAKQPDFESAAAESKTESTNVQTDQNDSEESPDSNSSGQLVFSRALPSDATQRNKLSANDIHVTYDASQHAIRIAGLWPEESNQTSDSESIDEEGRGRRRSRSPKRARVSDVDEATGEEQPYVEASTSQSRDPVSDDTRVDVPVPAGADVTTLRAELTDEGFQVWI